MISLVENKRNTTPTRKRVPHCQLFNSFLRQDKSLLKYIMSVGKFYILSLFRSDSINIKLESFLYTFDIAFNYIRKMKSRIIQLSVFMGKVTLDIYEFFSHYDLEQKMSHKQSCHICSNLFKSFWNFALIYMFLCVLDVPVIRVINFKNKNPNNKYWKC